MANYRNFHDNPEYFGAYLNMARHNIYLLVNDVAAKFSKDLGVNKFETLYDDARINNTNLNILLNVFDAKYPRHKEYRDWVYAYLVKKGYLPCLKVFNPEDGPKSKNQKKPKKTQKTDAPQNTDYKGIHRFLSSAFKEINRFRNAYTHHFAFDNTMGNELERIKNLSPESLDSCFRENLETLFQQASLYSFFNFESTQEGIEGQFKESDFEDLKNVRLFEGDNFTEKGLCFFICLFLEKRYAYKFLKKIKGFKDEQTTPFAATLKNYTAFTIKLPHDKLLSEDPKQSLLLDMLNELNRCPNELFRHLTPKDKEEFDPKLGATARENVIAASKKFLEMEGYEDEALDELLAEQVALKRKKNRFGYFALRFLDETELLKDVRFHINLGKIVMRQYPKQIAGETNNRKIQKTANAFDRLGKVLENDEEHALANIPNLEAENKEREAGNKIRFEQFAPHYLMDDNKIGIQFLSLQDNAYPYINDKENTKTGEMRINLEQPKPHAFLSIHALPRLVLLELLEPGEAEAMINDFMGKQDGFLQMQKLTEIKDKVHYEPDILTRIIIDEGKKYFGEEKKEEWAKRKDYRQYIINRSQILAPELKPVKANQLPGRASDYIMHIEESPYEYQVWMKVEGMLREVNQRLKDIKKGSEPKIGEMATYIAKDILNMVQNEGLKKTFTQPYYNMLQKNLAFYGKDGKQTAIEVCKERGIFDKDKGHVFWNEADFKNETNILELYLSYLLKKKKWIRNKLMGKNPKEMNIKDGLHQIKIAVYHIDKGRIPFKLKRFDYKIKVKADKKIYLESGLPSMQSKPVNLPVDLFDETLEKILRQKLGYAEDQNKKDRFSRLFAKYMDNDSQPFYNYKRAYRFYGTDITFDPLQNKRYQDIFDKVSGDIFKKEKEAEDKNETFEQRDDQTIKDQILLNFKYEIPATEQSIRHIQTQDRVVRLMCKELLESVPDLEIGGTILLSNMHPKNTNNNPLDWPVTFRQKIKDKTIIAKDNADQNEKVKNDPSQGHYWKVKDYGKFKRFLHDRRLSGLLGWFQENEIPISVVRHELSDYDKYRELFFDHIFDLEKAVIKEDTAGLKKLALTGSDDPQVKRKEYNQVQFDVYIGWLILNNHSADFALLRVVRNKMSHSVFPPPNEIQNLTDRLWISSAIQAEFDESHERSGYKANYHTVIEKIYSEYEKISSGLIEAISK